MLVIERGSVMLAIMRGSFMLAIERVVVLCLS